MENAWYTIKNIDQIDTPALTIYYDRLEENITKVIQMAEDIKQLRPHVKTHKSQKVTQLLLERGIRKFKCATISEAEMLAQCNVPDVLLAYQPVGPKQSRVLNLIKTYQGTQFSCLVDQFEVAECLSRHVRTEKNVAIPVYIDINVGMGRSGIVPGAKALKLYSQTDSLPGIRVEGFHIYDGHIRNIDLEEREKECNKSFQPVESMVETLKKSNIYPTVIAGGSPTFPIHTKRKNVECSPGTFVFWDKGYQNSLPEQDLLPAALVLTRIVSMPDDGTICLDLGYKSIASENSLTQRVYFLNAPKLNPISQHEEHLVMEVAEKHSLRIGDILYGIPIHICPTVALYDRANVVVEHKVKEEWRVTAGDRKITI